MIELSFIFGIISAIIVPLGIIATVQYCVHINRSLSFKKLILFSWSMVLTFTPVSFLAVLFILTSMNSDHLLEIFGQEYKLSSVCLSAGTIYIFLGWLACSAIYGEFLLPKSRSDKLDLP